MNIPLLSLIIFLPLVGIGFLAIIGNSEQNGAQNNAKAVGLWISLVNFVLTIVLWFNFDSFNFEYQFVEEYQWIKGMGISYYVGVDGLSLYFVIFSALLTPLCILFSWQTITKNVREYIMVFLLLETMVIGSFCAIDLVLFYVFFEGTLIPLFLMIGIWGGKDRIYACFKFFLYTLLGSVFMLLAIAKVYTEFGTTDLSVLLNQKMSFNLEFWLFLGFAAAMVVKLPMWPFHTWLPFAHVEAPTAGSVVLAGLLLKLGGYGFVRIIIPMLPNASVYFTPAVMTLSVIAIFYAAIVALVQKDMKKLIAYSSVSHMGFVTLGLFSHNLQGVTGAVVVMLGHGFVSSGMFFVIGMLYDRFHTRNIEEYGGLAVKLPKLAAVFLLLTLASISVPGTANFLGEFFVIVGAFKQNPVFAVAAISGVVLAPAYGLLLYNRIFNGSLLVPNQNHQGSEDEKNVLHDYKYYISGSVKDLKHHESLIIYTLLICTVFLGLFPKHFTDVINRTVRVKVLAEAAEALAKEKQDD